ncbi:Aminodeoxychorismate synthase component 1 [Rubripirellula tenax]|uniref:Aminodeoxychorismate synthase component 1 n=1 Tax=Rubripirellula tenax TaxID=2528015 RepID=A0A5C6FC85_9BACT|nr:anthranilate synthase component I family protein [Rubripirellula tenax]TWU59025.1 Aminodeoxychorismate synthase component 1 [Rubripirellula tenax]
MSKDTFPLSEALPDDFSLIDAFERLCRRPGCLWLDSASTGPVDGDGEPLGRYSFLTCDPIAQLVASENDTDPWPTLERWCRDLPSDFRADLPPFQGGIAGLIGYEAAAWLEPVGRAAKNDLPTPSISVGFYDWTIAVDHVTGQAWIVAQGFPSPGVPSPETSARLECARKKIADVKTLLSQPLSPSVAKATEAQVAPEATINDQFATDRAGVTSNFSRDGFCDAVAEIVRRICDGDSFQVNLAQRLLRRADRPSPDLYLRLRRSNPAPLGAYYDGGDFQVLSSSPEGFLKVRQRRVQTRPIKGTVRRTGHDDVNLKLAQKLLASEKDRAENVMIVDLMRNDLSRVCEDDSVVVSQLCQVERYEFVQHLVSVVEGRLSAERSIVDLLRACFPGGSVTGAPKIEAMRTIAELEKHPRGAYCGSIGYIGAGDQADFNILIRTITAAHGYWQIPVGGGITARSVPDTEEYETWSKAEGMMRAIESS